MLIAGIPSIDLIAQVGKMPQASLADDFKKNYDSIIVLSKQFPGSPLIIGRKRVVCSDTIYTSDNVKTDSIYTYDNHEYNLMFNDGLIIKGKFQYYSIEESTDQSRASIIVYRGSACGIDVNPMHDWIIDVRNPAIADSGDIVYMSIPNVRKVIRNGLTNYYEIGKGLLYMWDDPQLRRVKTIWQYRGSLIVVIRDEDDNYILLDDQKRRLSPFTFTNIAAFRGHDTTRFESVTIDPKKMYWTKVDLETGEVSSDRVLTATYLQWWNCAGAKWNCIDKFQFTSMENNHPTKTIYGAWIILEIKERRSERIVYRKKHFISLNLGPKEIGSSAPFYPEYPIWMNEEFDWNVEVLEIR